MRVRPFALVSALVVLLLGAIAAYWFIAVGRIEHGFAAWVDERRAAGWTVDYDDPHFGGFPFRVMVSVDDPQITTKGAAPIYWHGPSISGSAWLWDWRHIALDMPGHHDIEWRLPDRTRHFSLTAFVANGMLSMSWIGQIDGAEAHFSQVVADAENGASTTMESLNLEGHAIPASDDSHEKPSLDLSLQILTAGLPLQAQGPLGPTIDRLRLDLTVMGAFGEGAPGSALATWRDGGGTIQVDRLRLVWGPLRINANGTVALDSDMQPIGAFTGQMRGFNQTVDAFAEAGALSPAHAITAKLLLNGLAKSGEVGGAPEITVPLTVQDRHLYVGPVELLKVPPIAWP